MSLAPSGTIACAVVVIDIISVLLIATLFVVLWGALVTVWRNRP